MYLQSRIQKLKVLFLLQVRVFGLEEAENSPYNVFCFRIPAVVQTDSGVLLAFAEARVDTCADCAELGIAMRRSEDGGELKRHSIYSNKFFTTVT